MLSLVTLLSLPFVVVVIVAVIVVLTIVVVVVIVVGVGFDIAIVVLIVAVVLLFYCLACKHKVGHESPMQVDQHHPPYNTYTKPANAGLLPPPPPPPPPKKRKKPRKVALYMRVCEVSAVGKISDCQLGSRVQYQAWSRVELWATFFRHTVRGQGR